MAAPRALLIAGPTASGKTRLAVSVARRIGGEIVNADSMQVYADLAVLSARPRPDEQEDVPHHLFGHVDGPETYSVGRWLDEAMLVIRDIQGRGRAPLVVGGTGLYFKALTDGLAETPDPGDAARSEARQYLEDHGVQALARRAHELDPDAAAKVEAADTQRLLRIVEVAAGTGMPLSRLQADTTPALTPDGWRGAVLMPDRDALNARIAARSEAMLQSGAVEEVRALRARGLADDRPVMKALGVRTISRLIDAEIDRDQTVERLTIETRQYAKRQRTWFRNQTGDWPRIDPLASNAEESLIRALEQGEAE